MSKLIGLKLNEKLGILEAQELEFQTSPDNLVTIKAGVGKGKSTLGKAINIGLSAGSEREMPVDMKAYDGCDVEEEITYGDTPIFMRTTYKDGKLSSSLYIKDKEGKKCSNPIINGKKMTAAALRDELKTELTFGVQEFISDDPRRQMEWMMTTYKDRLKEMGVVFDKKSPNYEGSILYKLDQAKMDRSQKYERMRSLNAFKTAFESEGLKEEAIPEFIDIKKIEEEREKSTNEYYQKLREFEKQLNEIKLNSQKVISVMDSYNSSLENNKSLTDKANRLSVDSYNKEIDEAKKKRNDIYGHIQMLVDAGAPMEVVLKWFEELPPIGEYKEFVETDIHQITKDCGKYIHDRQYPDEIEKAFADLEYYRKEYVRVEKEQSQVIKPADEFSQRVEAAKTSNKIAERWAAFFDHQEADKEVKKLFAEYRKIFTSIDLGVDGLKIDIIGNEDDMNMRTVYNGAHNPELFGNKKGEYRPLSSYSETQKNILSILMQIHLLDEKKKKGDDALRFLFIEAPMDSVTKNMLIDYQKKYDLQLLCTMTCDVDTSTLKDGEIAIENGYLISKKV
jgi:hypothetical protein